MSPAMPPPRVRRPARVVVVGGGIAGLAAAWELTGGARGPAADTPQVVVLEAAAAVGGKIRSAEFAGRVVDLAADGFVARRPEGAVLAREVGLGDSLRAPGTSGASVWARGRARPLPDGLVLGVPTRLRPVVRSGILGWRGALRLGVDVVAPRADTRRPLGDRAIGPMLSRKLGPRAVDLLVDPMLGGIHAGTVADMSTAATFPLLLAVAQRRGSFMKALRQSVDAEARAAARERATADGADGDDGAEEAVRAGLNGKGHDHDEGTATEAAPPAGELPVFWALEGGMATLPRRVGEALAGRGATVRTSAPVGVLRRGEGGGGWVLRTPDGEVEADAVVLATPAAATADLLAPHDPRAAKLLRDIDHASVALVTLAYPTGALPADLTGTGLLVPRGTRLEGAGDDARAMVSACTYLTRKWPHVARPGDELIRASVGRVDDPRYQDLGDDELVARVEAELAVLLGLSGSPMDATVVRWADALPQYRVHHLVRVTGVETAVRQLGAVAVAGAAYRGVGIPACIASGRAAARQVLAELPGP